MKTTLALLALLGTAGCGFLTPRTEGRAPLESEGEVFLYLEPWPENAGRLTFTLSSASAVRADGVAVPLELLVTELSGGDAQRLLARGRLPPGTYRQLEFTARRASTRTPEGSVELLVADQPTDVAAAFQVRAQRATVLLLRADREAFVDVGHAFAPRFAVALPPRAMPQLLGVSVNTGTNDLTLFDRHRREVVGVVPTGRGPEGAALAPDLSRMYVAVSGEDQVAVFDTSTGEPLPVVRLAAGDRPRELAVSPDGRTLLVLNEGSNSLAWIDAFSGTEAARVTTGFTPISLLVDRSFRRAYVLNQGSNTMTVVDVAMRTVAATVPTDPGPLRAQLNRAGTRLYVIHSASPQMNVLSVPDMAVVNRITIGLGAAALKIDPRADLIYLARRGERRLYVYDPTSLLPVDFFDVPGGVGWIAIDDTENALVLSMPDERSVAYLDLPSRRQIGAVDVGADAYMVKVARERF